MNWTVGPHPSRVYWRRRFVLLALVLILLLTLVSCLVSRGSGGGKARLTGGPASGAARSGIPLGSAAAGSAPTEPQTTHPATTAATSQLPGAAAGSTTCPDASLTLTAVPPTGTVRIDSFTALHLLVKNTSRVACRRDLGSAQQELRIFSGATKVWSSDDCSNQGNAIAARSVRTIQPGGTFDFYVTWDGRASDHGCATGSAVTPGRYSLVARLGTRESRPVAFTLAR